jgi:hypothetical protein
MPVATARTAGDPLGSHYFDCQKLISRQPRSNDGCLSTYRPITPELCHIAARGPLCPCATNLLMDALQATALLWLRSNRAARSDNVTIWRPAPALYL